MSKLHNLQLHKLLNGKWVLYSTVIWNSPYSLCKGEKIKKDAYKAHFEFYKIVPNEQINTNRQVSSNQAELE